MPNNKVKPIIGITTFTIVLLCQYFILSALGIPFDLDATGVYQYYDPFARTYHESEDGGLTLVAIAALVLSYNIANLVSNCLSSEIPSERLSSKDKITSYGWLGVAVLTIIFEIILFYLKHSFRSYTSLMYIEASRFVLLLTAYYYTYKFIEKKISRMQELEKFLKYPAEIYYFFKTISKDYPLTFSIYLSDVTNDNYKDGILFLTTDRKFIKESLQDVRISAQINIVACECLNNYRGFKMTLKKDKD